MFHHNRVVGPIEFAYCENMRRDRPNTSAFQVVYRRSRVNQFSTAHNLATPRPNDGGGDAVFCRRAGIAQRPALTIVFIKNVITICADPIAVEPSDHQSSSISKGEGLCILINHKT